MPPATLVALAETVAFETEPQAVYAAVAQAADDLIGHKLCTIMAFDAGAMRVRRVFSSNVADYPPGDAKDKRGTAWGQLVLEQGKPYIGRTAEDIRANFDDHELIARLGLESILNVPVRRLGRVVGTMNLLNVAGFYSERDLAWGRALAAVLAGIIEKPD